MIVAFDELEPRWSLDQATALDARLFGSEAWSRETMRHELEDSSRLYVADVIHEDETADLADRIGGEDIGVQPGAKPSSPLLIMRGYAGMWHADAEAEILTVGVDRPYQRQGIAGNLLDRLISEARSLHVRRVRLEVRADSEAAQGLYHSKGFRDIGTLRHYYQPEDIDAVSMALDFERHIMGLSSEKRNME
ncbi:GNAT family N-acetyltransferase [Bifidobacterium sp. ESL0775]|uniref:GNAT family N-acetyltransferase n=1 Tax=Bifidobacterium sp. ESL0775 TaxID=2983230 RepID=UPI0023F710FC|nr:GNAT family N-acetyltransferase [Bifidobacterium sp. ESL0775]WEV68517.1 GNAT family N-acetyltransferase [Bifidobacterium sp. ESL0775]